MISFRRRGGALLIGMAVGALLVGGVAVAVPAGQPPVHAALGTGGSPTGSSPAGPSSTPPPAATADPATAPATPATATPTPTVAAPGSALPPPAPSRTTPPRSPSPRPAAPPPPRPAPDGVAAAVVSATNTERAAAGCAALRTDARLTTAADGHATDMATRGYFAHDSLDGRGFDDRIRAAGHPSPGGENIARGQPDAASVVTAWMDSPGHRRNILDCSFTTIGVGFDGRGNYWVQDFGR